MLLYVAVSIRWISIRFDALEKYYYLTIVLVRFKWLPMLHRQKLLIKRPVAEFKEFERRFKFKPRLKYGWFHLKLYQMFQDLNQRLI